MPLRPRKNQVKRKVKRRLESTDLRFKRGAMLISLMMGIDGGNMGRKQSRTTNFPGQLVPLIIILSFLLVFWYWVFMEISYTRISQHSSPLFLVVPLPACLHNQVESKIPVAVWHDTPATMHLCMKMQRMYWPREIIIIIIIMYDEFWSAVRFYHMNTTSIYRKGPYVRSMIHHVCNLLQGIWKRPFRFALYDMWFSIHMTYSQTAAWLLALSTSLCIAFFEVGDLILIKF